MMGARSWIKVTNTYSCGRRESRGQQRAWEKAQWKRAALCAESSYDRLGTRREELDSSANPQS